MITGCQAGSGSGSGLASLGQIEADRKEWSIIYAQLIECFGFGRQHIDS
jgi:hypothetical protein